jgi:hypothetical protein
MMHFDIEEEDEFASDRHIPEDDDDGNFLFTRFNSDVGINSKHLKFHKLIK